MNKLIILTAVLTVCMVGVARADMYTFDFTGLKEGDNASIIGTYMTSTYGSSITIVGAKVEQNPIEELGLPWTGKATSDSFIWTVGGGSPGEINIYFEEVPITGMQFEGFAFVETGDIDFQFKAYAGLTLVDSGTWNVGAGQPVFSPWIPFDEPVDRLWFSDAGVHDIGIDNLKVMPVPVPAAVFLGVLGLGVAGWKLRKFA